MSESVAKVHVIFKTHLDVGFTDYARNVLEKYLKHYIPDAITLARQLREEGEGARFIWTTGSWLIYEFLERSDTAGRKAMEKAIAAGDIVWHGLPFTTHSELMDASLFSFGLSLSQELDKRFGKKTIAAKMTDVPGHTIAIVPLLAEAGLRFLHIGVNPVCRSPQVPDAFTWRHPDGAEIVVMYNKASYGRTMRVPGLSDVLAFAHTNDNCGPQSVAKVRAAFAELRQAFPVAEVRASTLDDYARALLTIKDELPVVSRELGDSWIHGVGTDPWKVAAFRELLRGREKLLVNGDFPPAAASFKAFSRRLLLVAEHTWGLDEKVHLADYRNYARPDFEAARNRDTVGADAIPEAFAYARDFVAPERPRKYSAFAASWKEQREYLNEALQELHPHPSCGKMAAAINELHPKRFDRTGFAPVSGCPRTLRHFSIRLDPVTGALNYLLDKRNARVWADQRHPLGLFRYQTFSQGDYDLYLAQYAINMKPKNHRWAIPDLSKPGMAAVGAESRWWLPTMCGFYEREDHEAQYFLAELAMPATAVRQYGAPVTVELLYRFGKETPEMSLELRWFKKAANRMPEAIWCTFQPLAPVPEGWRMQKMGTAISPLEVIPHGNRQLHAVRQDIWYQDARGRFLLRTDDAPLVAPGEPSLLNFTKAQPKMKRGMHVCLYNNIWGTNFPMWYEEDARFRFHIFLEAFTCRPTGVRAHALRSKNCGVGYDKTYN